MPWERSSCTNTRWWEGYFAAYGVIWILIAAGPTGRHFTPREGLAEGRVIAMAPEGRESVTGALEDGNEVRLYRTQIRRGRLFPSS